MNYEQKCDISNFVAHEKNNFPCFPVMLSWQNYTLTTTTTGSERQYEGQLC